MNAPALFGGLAACVTCLNIGIPILIVVAIVWVIRHFWTRQNAILDKSSAMLEMELYKLQDMRKRGVINEAEYKRLRENIINTINR